MQCGFLRIYVKLPAAVSERRTERVFATSSVCLLGGADLRGFRASLDCGLQLIRDLILLS